MNTENHGPQPSPEPQPGNTGEQARPSSPIEHLQALCKEAKALIESGGDPARMKELTSELESEQVRVLEHLFSQDDKTGLIRTVELRRESMDMLGRIIAAYDRPDLTLRELLWIQKWFSRYQDLFLKLIELEKEFLEPKPRARKCGKRGHSPDALNSANGF